AGRPIPQSYSVYRPILDARNVAHLEGSHAPDNVFFAVDSIDYRLPSLDDSGSWLELLSKYKIVGYREPYVQLERLDRAFPSPIAAASATPIIKAKIKDSIPVSIPGPVWAIIDLQPTFLGRVVSAIDKLPQLKI